MNFINAEGAVLGRLASYAAKGALKGEEFVIVNCEKIIITGSLKDNTKKFQEKRGRVGSVQKGPKYSLDSEKILKRTIRGMIPNHRTGRGKEAVKRVKCYNGIPEEFKDKKFVQLNQERIKFVELNKFKK